MAVQIGQSLGNYRVVKKLGAGGIGAVYLAEHPLIGKKVALKVIHRELARNPEVMTRFVNEARAVNRIGSDHILDIADIGETADGDSFLVMELLDGQSLAEALRREPRLPVPRAVHIAAQIAEGLQAAHEAGIVHRDLKPDNVFLVLRRGDRDFVKLLDFGLAKLIDPGSPALTRAGVVLGTPQYMSPEQCESKGEIDARSDVYAVGVLMYQMLTGRLPFDGASMGEILIKHVSDAPVPVRAIAPHVPEGLERVVLRCLEKRPADRFPSMAELRAALVADEAAPVVARRARRPRVREEPPTWRGRFVVVAVFALLAVGLSAGGVLLLRRSARVAEPAPAPRVEAVPLAVSVRVASRPPGAEVVDEATGARLGVTPLALDVQRGQPRVVILRMAGFAERHELIGADAGDVELVLERLPAAAPVAAPHVAEPPRPPPRKAKRKPEPASSDDVLEPRSL